MSRTATEVAIRSYVDADEPAVLALLDASLGGGPAGRRPPEFFRWKHLENPFGRSLMLVAESEGRIVGLRAFMRWRFVAGDRQIRAVRAVDTATHPDHQGKGIFSRLTMEALERLRGDADLVFNTPNEKSLPGYLKMGWQVVGRVPVRVRVRRPVRFARGVRSIHEATDGSLDLPPAGEDPRAVLDHGEAVDELLSSLPWDGRLATDRTAEFLRWRYTDAPLLGYRSLLVFTGNTLAGVAWFRVRRRGQLVEATVADVLPRGGDPATASQLLRRAARAVRVDHATCSFPPGNVLDRAALRSGFVAKVPGPVLVARPISDSVATDPMSLRSWALSGGDVEVF